MKSLNTLEFNALFDHLRLPLKLIIWHVAAGLIGIGNLGHPLLLPALISCPRGKSWAAVSPRCNSWSIRTPRFNACSIWWGRFRSQMEQYRRVKPWRRLLAPLAGVETVVLHHAQPVRGGTPKNSTASRWTPTNAPFTSSVLPRRPGPSP